MGKSKQTKEKKFDRNVEISAPILDPEIIKAIHSPPKGGRLDLRHDGFKALLADLNSQDSTDELTPLNESHVPSYIGISCAVSGYSNYSSYSKRNQDESSGARRTPIIRSQTTSPSLAPKSDHINHITIDRTNIHSPDEERRELTEKLTASATERRRSPSPCVPPVEDDRHHGAYVGARYCPLPEPSKVVHKHIPLLGIDDDKNPDEIVPDANKVEKNIASLYGDEFVDDWRESMSHKVKKELSNDDQSSANQQKSLKDLITLKPAPSQPPVNEELEVEVDLPVPDVKVLANVERPFLNRLLSDNDPPSPSRSPQLPGSEISPPLAKLDDITPQPRSVDQGTVPPNTVSTLIQHHASPPLSPESANSQSTVGEVVTSANPLGEEHIEYEIRAGSPIGNQSSPVKIVHQLEPVKEESQEVVKQLKDVKLDHEDNQEESLLVSFSPELISEQVAPKGVETIDSETSAQSGDDAKNSAAHGQIIQSLAETFTGESKDGTYFLKRLDEEKGFISDQVTKAETILAEQESTLNEDAVGRIRSTIGKANLLTSKKCKQFRELCEANLNKSSDEPFVTLNDDLAGFWDMLSIQIDEVRKLFEAIWQAKENDWEFETKRVGDEEHSSTSLSARSSKAPHPVAKSKLSAQKDQERRERLHEHMKQMKQLADASANKDEISGFDIDNSSEQSEEHSSSDLSARQLKGSTAAEVANEDVSNAPAGSGRKEIDQDEKSDEG